MSLEATHIRFALDLKDDYHVTDPSKFVVGAIYPDSRYVTKLDRALTHPTDFHVWNWKNLKDFKKGWLTHLWADELHRNSTRQLLPDVFEGATGQGSEVWIKHTAIKILQDHDDITHFDITPYLSALDSVETPNGEDPSVMKKYQNIFQRMYGNPTKLTLENCYIMWKELGIADALAEKLKAQTEAYQQDASIMAKVRDIYPHALHEMRKLIEGNNETKITVR